MASSQDNIARLVKRLGDPGTTAAEAEVLVNRIKQMQELQVAG